jgi:hypothetical protein
VKGSGVAATAVRRTGGSVFPVSAGPILLDQQILETPRYVAKFPVDQMEVAREIRRRRLVAEEPAHETVVLSHEVFETPANVSKLRQRFRPGVDLASVSFRF